MATLEKIRKRIGVIAAITIGLALLSFILGDFLTSGNTLFRDSQTRLADIAGKKVSIMEFQDMVDQGVENYKRNMRQSNIDQETMDQIRDQVWEQLVRDAIMEKEYSALGLGLSEDEIFDMVQGNFLHSQILQVPIFKNEAGQFDRNKVLEFLKNMENDETGQAKSTWIEFEKSLVKDRLNSKYNELIKKGLYVTKAEAQAEVVDRNYKVTADYIMKRFNEIPDSLMKFDDGDLKDYYSEHAKEFEQVPSRDIAYVTFEVAPSDEDNRIASDWINGYLNEFISAPDATQYVNLKSDEPFTDRFYKKGELAAVIDSFMFASKAGAYMGPYFDAGSYKISKLVAIENRPDSVKARHILLSPDDNNRDVEILKTRADSILNALKKGSDFVMLAKKYSADKGSLGKDGDLGWFKEGVMVKPFNDVCFGMQKGQYEIIETQFGIHVIQLTDRGKEEKKVQVATLERRLEASPKTYQFIYQKASMFAGNNTTAEAFEKAVTDQNLGRKVATNLRETDRSIAGLENPRELIRWVFSAEKGDVTPKPYEFGNFFVVALVTETRDEKIPSFDEIKTDIEVAVRKEKAAEFIIQDFEKGMAGTTDLTQIASNLKLTVTTTPQVNFSNLSIPGLGFEPAIVGNIIAMKKDELSRPIKGNNAVYVIKIKDVTEPGENLDVEKERDFLKRSLQSKTSYMPYNVLNELANIKDNRSKFF